jgi:serine/threonine-protein kinase
VQRFVSSAVVLGVLAGQATAARAQPAGGSKVSAEALFEEGRRLAQEGNYAAACPKFADSERLDPSAGTLLNLANCYEKTGKTATAWATYREAASVASAAGRAQELKVAQKHADALAPKLARLTITVAQAPEGLLLTRDGVAMARAEWGTAIPIDAGTHSLVATAPGFKDWKSTVDVPQDGAQVTGSVPALEALPAPPPPPPNTVEPPPPPPAPPVLHPEEARPEAPRSGGWPALKTVGVVVGGFGVVGLGVAAGFAVAAANKNSDSKNHCLPSDANVCDATGVSLRNGALDAGNAATIAVSVGAALAATGVVLWIAAPSGSAARSSARVRIAPTLGGVEIAGSW